MNNFQISNKNKNKNKNEIRFFEDFTSILNSINSAQDTQVIYLNQIWIQMKQWVCLTLLITFVDSLLWPIVITLFLKILR